MPKSPDRPMKWTDTQEQALGLAFEGRWTQEEIAAKCHIAPRTYRYWLTHPEFVKRLADLQADFAASIRDVAYADKARRILALSQLAEQARRQYEEHELLIEDRPTRDGTITIERFNADAHAAARAALADIAAEKGERKNVTEVSGKDGAPMQTQMTLDLATLQAALQAAFADDPEGRYAAAAALAQLAHGAQRTERTERTPKPA